MKKLVSSALIVGLLIGSLLLGPALAVGPPPIRRPGELITATIEGGVPETVDPAWAYDTASGELLFNVYDTLVTFDAEHMERYLPSLATDWWVEDITGTKSPEGLSWYFRYTFEIRGQSGRHPLKAVSPNPYGGTGSPLASTWEDTTADPRWTGVKWTVIKWTDTDGDGKLSPCDQVKMERDQHPGDSGGKVCQYFHFNSTIPGTPFQGNFDEKIPEFHDKIHFLNSGDVEYSFERAMVQDRDGGPTWMFYEPLLNTWGALGLEDYGINMSLPEGIIAAGKMIDHAVESNATHVWFNLAFPGAYAPFLQILCQTWSSIMSKEWVSDHVIGTLGRPDWNGEWGDYTGWIALHNPDISPLDTPDSVMCGTGPFKFEILDTTAKYWSVVRFDQYWHGWPQQWPELAGSKPVGYIERLTTTWAYLWETRSTMFLAGDVDFCAVPRAHIGEVANKDGIRLIFPLPTLTVDAIFFQFMIDPATPYGPVLPAGTFDETGVPTDFFGNPTWGVHVRKAFAYSFDYDTFLSVAYLGEAMHPSSAIIPTLRYYDPTVQGYTLNLAKAEEEFKKVPGLWTTGFTIIVLYNTGNLPRQTAANLLKEKLEGLNPKFHVNVASADWKVMLRAHVRKQLPTFLIGWLADFPDPHNFALPFYASYGTFSAWQSYSNPEMDALIEAGIRTPEGPERQEIYTKIQKLAVEDCPCTTIDMPIGRHWERDWVVGWYYNPIYPGLYACNLWKWYYVPHSLADTSTQPTSTFIPVDVNYDGKVDIKDIAVAARSFGASAGPPIHPRWVFKADFNGDRKIDIRDIALVARNFGKTSATWTPPS